LVEYVREFDMLGPNRIREGEAPAEPRVGTRNPAQQELRPPKSRTRRIVSRILMRAEDLECGRYRKTRVLANAATGD